MNIWHFTRFTICMRQTLLVDSVFNVPMIECVFTFICPYLSFKKLSLNRKSLFQIQVDVPLKQHTNHMLKRRRKRFANCYNCSARGHYGYVSVSWNKSFYTLTIAEFIFAFVLKHTVIKDLFADLFGVFMRFCWANWSTDLRFFFFSVGIRSALKGGWSAECRLHCLMFATMTVWRTSSRAAQRSRKKPKVNKHIVLHIQLWIYNDMIQLVIKAFSHYHVF